MFSHLYVMSVVVLRYTIRRCCCSTAIDTHNQSTPDATRRTEHTPLEEAQLGVRGGDCEAVRRCWHRSVQRDVI